MGHGQCDDAAIAWVVSSPRSNAPARTGVIRHSGSQLLLIRQLLVGGSRRLNDQGFGIPYIGEVAYQLKAVHKFGSIFFGAFHRE